MIWDTGAGNHTQITNKARNGIWEIGKTIGWEMGHGQDLGWEIGFFSLQDPVKNVLVGSKYFYAARSKPKKTQ